MPKKKMKYVEPNDFVLGPVEIHLELMTAAVT
jgi:hypothetical protein